MLNIYDKVPITLHSVYAVPLSIILSDTDYWKWFYQNFMQIFSTPLKNSAAKQELLYYGRGLLFEQVLSIKKLENIREIDHIVSKIINYINNSLYAFILMDMFFVKEKSVYKKRHESQNLLFFGYDITERVFYVKGYNHNYVFDTYKIKFDELEESFLYFKNNNNVNEIFSISIIQFVRNENILEFSVNKIRVGLRNYLNSENEIDEFKREGHTINELRYFGINAYRDFSNYIEIAINNRYEILYHDFHLFYEHRKLNLERFKYINNLYKKNIEIDTYYELVIRCNKLRLFYMKNTFQQGSLYAQINNKKIMLEIKEEIDKINNEEEKILSKIKF